MFVTFNKTWNDMQMSTLFTSHKILSLKKLKLPMYLIKNHPIKASEGGNLPVAQCSFCLGTKGRSTKTNLKD